MEIQRKHKVIPLGEEGGGQEGSVGRRDAAAAAASRRRRPLTPQIPPPTPQNTGGRVLDLGCVPGAWLQVACQEVGPPDRYPRARVVGVDIQPPAVPPRHCDWRVRVIEADARAIGPAELLRAAAGGREEEEEAEAEAEWGEGGGRGGEQEEQEGAAAGRRRRGRGASPSSASSALLPFDAVLSDMLHFTSGAGDVDVARSLELAGTALHAAVGYHYDEAERAGGDEGVAAVEQATGVARHSGLLRTGGCFVVKVYEGAGVDGWLKDARGYFERVVRLRVAASRSMSREFYAIGLARRALPRGAPPLACDLDVGGRARAGGGGGPPSPSSPSSSSSAAAAAAAAAPAEDEQGARRARPERTRRRAAGGGGARGGEGRPRPPATRPPAEAPPSEW
jgi:23S rRNA (uridine2552-2'-O)-methyltransferase